MRVGTEDRAQLDVILPDQSADAAAAIPIRDALKLLLDFERHVGVERVGKDFLSRNTSRYRFTSPLQPTRLPQLGEKHRQTALKTFAVKRLLGQSSEQR